MFIDIIYRRQIYDIINYINHLKTHSLLDLFNKFFLREINQNF